MTLFKQDTTKTVTMARKKKNGRVWR